MGADVTVSERAPESGQALAMLDVLWLELEERYGFTAPNELTAADFSVPRAAFWVATAGDTPVGSVGIKPLDEDAAELDAMYVAPWYRRTGVASKLLRAAETRSRSLGYSVIRLRAGAPQPEALAFCQQAGFVRIPGFGRWIDDPTALCFEKAL